MQKNSNIISESVQIDNYIANGRRSSEFKVTQFSGKFLCPEIIYMSNYSAFIILNFK